MSADAQETMARVQCGLQRRQRLRSAVDALLWGTGTAAGVLALAAGGWGDPVWAAVAGVMAASLAGVRAFYRPKVTLGDAGLYLDRSFSLKERMSALAARSRSRSVFADALVEDANRCVASLDERPLLGALLPQRASYLAVPLALIAALVLLARFGPSQAPQPSPAVPSAVPLDAAPTATDEAGPRGLVGALLADLHAAQETYAHTGREADRLRVERLEGELLRTIEELEASGKASVRRPGGGADGPGTGTQAGTRPERLRVAVETAEGETPEAAVQAVPDRAPDASPDWSVLSLVEAELPPARRTGVRAYLHALVEGGSESTTP